MTKKLFILCPFSKMEPFIRKHFGELIYCMTFPGTDFYQDTDQKMEQILHFVKQEEITDIILVNDLDCPFLSGIIKNKPLGGWPFENTLQDLFLSQYINVFKEKSKLMRQIKLSEMYILYQAQKFTKELAKRKNPGDNPLKIKALMTCRSQDLLKELPLKQLRYEC